MSMDSLKRGEYIKPTIIPRISVRLEDKERAFEWLEKAYADRGSELVDLGAEPGDDPLGSDPRFQDLLRRVGLPP